ncbi:MAG: flagellar biosynthesis anti-sigma factor FlgM [Acidimicrobiia bacterium]
MNATPERLAQLRRAIAEGSYAPDPVAVGESLLGWIARPEQLDGRAGWKDPVGPDQGPLDPRTGRAETADDADPRR